MFIFVVILVSVILVIGFVGIETLIKKPIKHCNHHYVKMECFGNTSRFYITQCEKCNYVRFNTWND